MIRSISKLAKRAEPISLSLVDKRTMSLATRKTVTLIPGDGIGPEIAASVRR